MKWLSRHLIKKYIPEAINYIDKNEIPARNKSTKYELVWENGNKYPPKYVIAVAHHLATGVEIDISAYNAVEAKGDFESHGYSVQSKQVKFELTITTDEVVSTDESFTMNNLSAGDNYKPLDAYFSGAGGETIRRNRAKGENKISNMTLSRIAFQLYEKQIIALSKEEKETFPICRYTWNGELIKGIFPGVEAFKQYRNTIENLVYKYTDDRQLVI